MNNVASDEPLYEAISNLESHLGLERKMSAALTWRQVLFVSIASSFCGVTVWYTIDSSDIFPGGCFGEILVSIGTASLLGLSALTFQHARCTVSLMLPVLFSGVGRSLLRAVIIGLLVAGPLHNITHNVLLLSRSIECSAQLTIDQANSTAHSTIRVMKQQMEFVRNTSQGINEQSEKMSQFADREMVEILKSEDSSNGHLSPSALYEQGSRQCRQNTDGPRKRCESGLSSDVEKCNQLLTQGDVCSRKEQNKAELVNKKHTQEIAENLQSIRKEVPQAQMNIRAGHKINFRSTTLNKKFVELMSKIDYVGSLVSRLTRWVSVILLGAVLIRSIEHQVRYLTKLSYLNDVVTSDLLQLDGSLPVEHRVFPLPSYMKNFVREGKRKFLTGAEMSRLLATTAKHLIFSLVFLLIMFLDSQVCSLLEDIADTGYIVYEVYITLGVLMKSDGGKWTRSIMDELSTKNNLHHLSFSQDNNRCLPDATPPDSTNRLIIGVFVMLTLLLNVLEVYSQRAIRRICGWFYPGREKQRVQFLYRFLKQRRLDCFQTLVDDRRAYLPRVSKIPRCFWRLFCKESCTICQSKKIHSKCLRCFEEGFDVLYCLECWTDAKSQCPFCELAPEPEPFEELNLNPPQTLNKYLPLRNSFAESSSDEEVTLANTTRTLGPKRKRPSKPAH